MPEHKTRARVRQRKREGKAATTQAGEFVREEMHHAKRGKHRVKNRKQAIAIGLSKARRSGVKVSPKKSRAKSTDSKQRTSRRRTASQRTRPGRTKKSR